MLHPIRRRPATVQPGMRTARPTLRTRHEPTDWEREWQAAETVERLDRPHTRAAASAFAAAAGGAATAYGAWAGDLRTSAQVALAILVSGLTMAVVPLALRGAATRVHLLVVIAALLSAGAAAIHFAVIQDHFEEWWGYGVFFVASGIAQLAW